MTQVAAYDHGRAPAPRPAQPGDAKADKVRKTIARIRIQFLAPFDAWERAAAGGAVERGRMIDRPQFLSPRVLQPMHPATEEQRAFQLARFDASLKNQPEAASLADLRADMDAAANGSPLPAATRLIIGTMVASFPNVRPHSPETYLEALIEALDHTGLPPAAIAKTCNEIYLTSTFAPTGAEVLEKAKEVHATLSFRVKQIDRYAEIMDWAVKVRSWLETVPLLAPDRSNAARAPLPPANLSYHPSRVDWV